MSYANSILYHTLADPVRPRYCCSERHHWQETNNFVSSRSLGKCGYFFTRWVPRKRKKSNQRANVNIHRAWLVWYAFCVLFPKLATKRANTHTHTQKTKKMRSSGETGLRTRPSRIVSQFRAVVKNRVSNIPTKGQGCESHWRLSCPSAIVLHIYCLERCLNQWLSPCRCASNVPMHNLMHCKGGL